MKPLFDANIKFEKCENISNIYLGRIQKQVMELLDSYEERDDESG